MGYLFVSSLLIVFAETGHVDLTHTSVLIVDTSSDVVAATAFRVLLEETEKRTGVRWSIAENESDAEAQVILQISNELPRESFSIEINTNRVVVSACDGRGLLFGVGHFLRHMQWKRSQLKYPTDQVGTFSPRYAMRGHQLGYRYQSNCYDTWTDAQYEQYIRELALFGCNSIENIPFQDSRLSPHMPLPRSLMNRRMSEICKAYGMDYWIWTPAEFDLSDTEQRTKHIQEHIDLYESCPELTGVFFPGGDPGANPPEVVLPLLEELAVHLRRHHPSAKLWLSLQWFNEQQCTDIYAWIDKTRPDWFGGLVSGPGSPTPQETRKRLITEYPVRHYPDITHTVRCQYPVPWWDPAFAFTLGREPINPQPVYYGFIHNYFAPYTSGFITYSDGVNDDVNKVIWSRRGWDPTSDIRQVVTEYARFFFSSEYAEMIADGILALEKNWEGPLAENGGVRASLALWQRLERELPELASNWRWQMLLVRAYYDAYTRERLIFESELEKKANSVLLKACELGTDAALTAAQKIVSRADSETPYPEWKARIIQLYDDLFHSIGLKSSVEKYKASGYERGCSLDFLGYPLNNRWFLEDEFKKIGSLPDEEQQCTALVALAQWENPGEGSFYDNIGHPGQSLHVKRTESITTDPNMERGINPGFWWWDSGFSRARLSWQVTLDFPVTLVYHGLDPAASYVLRITGYGEAHPRANGFALVPSVYNLGIGEIKEFPIPQALTRGGMLEITFDPLEESHLNWRYYARIAEAWLLKQ